MQVKPELLNLQPKQLKSMSKSMADNIKNQIKEMKQNSLSKQQKKLNKEYEEELNEKALAEVSQTITNFKEVEKLKEEEYLEILYKIAINKSGKEPEFRIVELKEMLNRLILNQSYLEDSEYLKKQNLIILSNFK